MNLFNLEQKVQVNGRWGGTVKRIITLDAPKWKPDEKTRYQYLVYNPQENYCEIVDESKLSAI
jgi:hypothetical protein